MCTYDTHTDTRAHAGWVLGVFGVMCAYIHMALALLWSRQSPVRVVKLYPWFSRGEGVVFAFLTAHWHCRYRYKSIQIDPSSVCEN